MNRFYEKGIDRIGTAGVNLTTADIRVRLVDLADYTPDFVNDEALDDIPGAARVGNAVALTSKTLVGGVFDADDPTIATVSGDESEVLIGYIHNATESLAYLLFYIDTATGLPIDPNGGNITVQFPNSGYKIFKLG